MEDNILNIKKEMIKKAKIKDLSRLEKYMLVQKEIQYLNFEERKLLIAELKRDLKAIDGMSTVKDTIQLCLSIFGIITPCIFSGIFINTGSIEWLSNIAFAIILFSMGMIVIFNFINIYQRNALSYTWYILDALTDYSDDDIFTE